MEISDTKNKIMCVPVSLCCQINWCLAGCRNAIPPLPAMTGMGHGFLAMTEKRGNVPLSCHCEPVRRLARQSVSPCCIAILYLLRKRERIATSLRSSQ